MTYVSQAFNAHLKDLSAISSDLHSGANTLTLPDVLALKEASKLPLPPTMWHALITLKSFLLVLAEVFGPHNRLTTNYRLFIHALRHSEMLAMEYWDDLNCPPLLPAQILHWVDLRLKHFFLALAHSPTPATVLVPDFQALLQELHFKTFHLMPPLQMPSFALPPRPRTQLPQSRTPHPIP